ncbi:hypothetical protein BACT_1294 [Bifidobacterium actinocoloniiforme DSM 22766]|uniref:Permeases of the major facilitator superfamily n=1 Tax=Bifidobacterium actinocoloniiforme DSM 22766 TaxID=1437605 RepID=A0A086Z240_9BIFI|nr:hypothetical protein [Bifidobacterium actinocoloniiforme]AKV55986.1 hypothetical protein AB656_07395 [Bifidobacterium actinocoloniiforme DSM 22766]KFI40590.1 hypothetical protein BACT_1294 [Bifidobacterium actinocoloniiforme DSM 22766]
MRFLASFYRLALAAFALAASYQGWLKGMGRAWTPLDFQACLVLAFVMLWAGAASLLKGVEPPAWLKGFAILYSLIGALAAWAMEGSAGLGSGPRVWGVPVGLMTRVLIPVMAALDFLLFDPHRRFSWHYPLSWMAYLPCYLAFVLVRAAIWPGSGSGTGPNALATPYPYPGLDLRALGWARLTVNAAEYLLVCFALALCLFLVDRILPRRTGLSVGGA